MTLCHGHIYILFLESWLVVLRCRAVADQGAGVLKTRYIAIVGIRGLPCAIHLVGADPVLHPPKSRTFQKGHSRESWPVVTRAMRLPEPPSSTYGSASESSLIFTVVRFGTHAFSLTTEVKTLLVSEPSLVCIWNVVGCKSPLNLEFLAGRN